MKKIRVKLGERSYNIVIGHEHLSNLGKILNKLAIGRDAVVVTNEFVKKKYGKELESSLWVKGFSVKFIVVPQNPKLKENIKEGKHLEEKIKSQDECSRLIRKLAKYDGERKKIFLVALGGGVVGDLVGYIAAIYRRGIPYIQVPTTLLAQVDSSIGGKVGIDLPEGKNLVGAFYQPKLVFIDTKVLSTLSQANIKNGLAEIIKYGVIRDKNLFKYIENNYNRILNLVKRDLEYIISTSTWIKSEIVGMDEYDTKNRRVILNYGHTIGHAIEAAAKYRGYYSSHGVAVGIGMICAAEIANRLGMISRNDIERIEGLIRDIGLPAKIRGLNLSSILKAQSHDKKFIHGKNRFVLPIRIGQVVVREGIPIKIIKDVLKRRMDLDD